MKILMFIDHLGEGGAERVATVLTNYFSNDEKNKIKIVLFINKIEYSIDNAKKNVDIDVIDYSENKVIRVKERLNFYVKSIKSFQPDVIYALGNVVSIYSGLAHKISHSKSKLIVSERTDPSREPHNFILKKVRNMCYGMADVLVCQTESAKEYFPNYIQKKSVVIPNPISPNLPRWTGEKSKVIITACRLEKQKNLPMLLEAFKKIHNQMEEYELHIYGNGSLRQEIENYIVREGLEDAVKLMGFSKQIANKMAEAYMYVSSSDYEGISNSMLEALGIGVPTICTDCPVGGARMFIESGTNGILVKVGDVEGLYMAMKKMIEDSKFAKRVSKESVAINYKINIDTIAARWIDLINN